MRSYKFITDFVINYLTENQYCSALVRANERCFEKFEAYLNQKAMHLQKDSQIPKPLKGYGKGKRMKYGGCSG